MTEKSADELKAFNEIVSALRELQADRMEPVLRSVLTFLGISLGSAAPTSTHTITNRPQANGGVGFKQPPTFSEDRSISPKQFMMQKQPRTGIERVTCLAYYLTHYRDMPHFKTVDLSKLNTEAAQPKLSNAAYDARNAVNTRYLAPATKGQKQLSAAGEIFVTNLPDHAAAKEAMAAMVRRKKSARPKKKRDKAAKSNS